MSLMATLHGFGMGASLTIVMGEQCLALSGGKKLAPCSASPRAWHGLDCLIAVIRRVLTLGLILKP